VSEISNADRANLAFCALKEFSACSGVDTARDAIADLICNLLHLARGRGLDEQLILAQAGRMAAEEAREDDDGEMDEVQERFRELLSEDL
jgi:hypothetical protein